jgi:hypothetical protein
MRYFVFPNETSEYAIEVDIAKRIRKERKSYMIFGTIVIHLSLKNIDRKNLCNQNSI